MEEVKIDLQSVICLQISDKTAIVRSTLQSLQSDVMVQQELAQFHDDWPKIETFFQNKKKLYFLNFNIPFWSKKL